MTETDELFNPPSREPNTWVSDALEPGSIITLHGSDTRWKMGPIQSENVQDHDDEEYGSVTDSSSLCVATQVEGHSLGMKAVMKIKLQLTQWSQPLSNPEIIPVTYEIDGEITYLMRLTEGGCSSTPRLLDYEIFVQSI